MYYATIGSLCVMMMMMVMETWIPITQTLVIPITQTLYAGDEIMVKWAVMVTVPLEW